MQHEVGATAEQRIRSLCRRTDLIFARVLSEVCPGDGYVAIRTPDNPGYHWGNFIIFDRPPRAGDRTSWEAAYRKEFHDPVTFENRVFTWETPEKGKIEEFIESGYELDRALGLQMATPRAPKRRLALDIRPLRSDVEWAQGLESQIACADPEDRTPAFRRFKTRQMSDFRKLCDLDRGAFLGVFEEGRVVAHLGIFWEGGLARYQTIATAPERRGRGYCGTLVYETARWAIAERGIRQLVIEVEADEAARRVYESVGFEQVEENYSLSPA